MEMLLFFRHVIMFVFLGGKSKKKQDWFYHPVTTFNIKHLQYQTNSCFSGFLCFPSRFRFSPEHLKMASAT